MAARSPFSVSIKFHSASVRVHFSCTVEISKLSLHAEMMFGLERLVWKSIECLKSNIMFGKSDSRRV